MPIYDCCWCYSKRELLFLQTEVEWHKHKKCETIAAIAKLHLTVHIYVDISLQGSHTIAKN